MSFKAFQSHGEFAEEVIFSPQEVYIDILVIADALIQNDV